MPDPVQAPRIDVLIPVYNGAATVEAAVGSIQAQTVRDIRIVVVDDGSTDDTGAILDRMAEADPRLLVIHQPNGGIVDALNAGLAACTAPLVARHDADDMAVPERFERQLAWLGRHPGCVALGGSFLHMNERGEDVGAVITLPPPSLANPGSYPQQEPYMPHPFLMMRRAAAQAAGGYRYVFHAEDTDLYWRLQEHGDLANPPDFLGHYRIHSQSIMAGSALNGRIAAVGSQLAGLSAMRRRANRPDLVFAKGALAEYRKAGTLRGIVALASAQLDPEEAVRLAAAASAKLMDLAGYRPYQLDEDDAAFMREAILRALPGMEPADRGRCIRALSGTAARLARQGRLRAASLLAPKRYYPLVAARILWQAVRQDPFRGAMQQAARPQP